jgi:hypothetical protein
MTPAAARASYRRAFARECEPIVLKRGEISATALGKVEGYSADELTGGVNQGDQKVVLLAEDLEFDEFPLPPVAGDQVEYLGRTLFVMFPPTQRRIGTTTVAYDLVVRG